MGLGLWGFLAFLTGLRSFPFFLGYLLVVFTWPLWRRMLPPFQLRTLMVAHNVVCVLLSAATLSGMAYALVFHTGHLYSREAHPFLTDVFRLYWFSKYFEWLDTAFMMLRQKSRQISFLHVYHHSAMVLLSDYAANVSPWPCMGFPLALNSGVHVAVYSYYAYSALSEQPLSASWKRRLTQLQILQFFLGLVYCSWGWLAHGFCLYSIGFGLTMVALFANFYRRAYLKPLPDSTANGKAHKHKAH